MVLFPLIGIFLAFTGLGKNFLYDNNSALRLVSGTLFFNSIHTCFTYFILTLPECRPIIKNRSFKFAAVFYMLILVLTFLLLKKLPFDLNSEYKEKAFLFIFLTIPFIHAIKQSFGVLLIETNSSLVRLDRGFTFMASLVCVLLAGAIFVNIQNYTNFVLVFFVATVSVYLSAVFFTAKSEFMSRLLFVPRIILFALSPISLGTALFTNAVHGIESIRVFKVQLRNTQAYYKTFIPIMVLCLVPIILVTHHPIFMSKFFGYSDFSDVVFFLTIVGWTNFFMHFYLERQLYIFRLDQQRSLVKPLLKGL